MDFDTPRPTKRREQARSDAWRHPRSEDGGVPVDGAADTVPTAAPTWEAVHGALGSVISLLRNQTSLGTPTVSWFYRDDQAPAEDQCWGDSSYYAASGSRITSAIDNTDPAATPYATLQGRRLAIFLPATQDGQAINTVAQSFADNLDHPVTTTATNYTP